MTVQIIHNDPRDPWNRLEIHTGIDGKTVFNAVQDVEPIAKEMQFQRNNKFHDGKQGEFNLFASIPNIIVYKLKQQGIDIFRMKKDPSMRRKFLKIMQYQFPEYKATNRVHL